MIYHNILETIGNTPLVKINNLTTEEDATIYAKVESFNPSGSVKDRAALSIIEQAEKDGILKKGDTIIEPTSGNMGIGLAMIAAVKGYDIILVMSENMSKERQSILKSYGAEIILSPGDKGTLGSVEIAEKLAKEKGYFMPFQFSNPNNPKAHIQTAKEILTSLDGKIDAFVSGVGTGGTLIGVSKTMKETNPHLKAIAVEPKSSSVLSGKASDPHKIQGIGANFIPDIFDQEYVDDILQISNEDAYAFSKELALKEGIFAGISSGANIAAAIQVAKELGKGKVVVTVLPDTGERYLSTDLHHE